MNNSSAGKGDKDSRVSDRKVYRENAGRIKYPAEEFARSSKIVKSRPGVTTFTY